MAIKLGATGITFPDNTVQTTSGGPVVDQYAIGSYIQGRPQNTTNYNNATIAGSSLYATSNLYYSTAGEGGGWNPFGTAVNSLVNTGSWRCVSIAGYDGGYVGAVGLWVRYA